VIYLPSTTDAERTGPRADSRRHVVPTDPRIEVPIIGRSTSRIGFGTGGLLRIGSARQRQDALSAAFAGGIRHFDTAPIYGFGESERALGRFLRSGRHEVTLTTKFGLRPSGLAIGLAPLQRVARRALQFIPSLHRAAVRNTAVLYAAPCFSPGAVQASLEASLRSLRTDYVDFYLAHQASSDSMPEDDLIDRLQRLRCAGKILAFGLATDFDMVIPVLEQRPQLSGVVQFDGDLSQPRLLDAVAGIRDSDLATGSTRTSDSSERLIITYGSLRRSIALCRSRLDVAASAEGKRVGAFREFDELDDETIGGMLLRAAVVANPSGIVLMQSRSIARIARNIEAATCPRNDEQVRSLVRLMRKDSRVVEPLAASGARGP
jgi:D-threo-aldose 1-dehydrogenase